MNEAYIRRLVLLTKGDKPALLEATVQFLCYNVKQTECALKYGVTASEISRLAGRLRKLDVEVMMLAEMRQKRD